jgi:hypothetical protein
MKKIIAALLPVVLLASCGSTDSKSLAKDVCDCYKKANAMDAADPKRSAAQNDCIKKQGEAWDKLKDNQQKADEFNKIIGDCAKDLMNQSTGK